MMRLKKDFVSSSLHDSSFSCSRFTASATVLRTLLPSGIVTRPPPHSTLGTNGLMAKQLSILRTESTMQLRGLAVTAQQSADLQRYSQLDGRLVPEGQRGPAPQHGDHDAQTAL